MADPQTLLACAAEIGLDLPRLEADFESEAALQSVLDDQQEASSLGVNATPTVVFDDQWVLPGAVPIETYRRVIGDLLAGRDPAAGA